MNEETSGVWVQFPDDEVDILQYDYIDREFSVLNGKYQFKFKKVRGCMNEMEVWLRRHNLYFADSFLRLNRYQSLEDLHDFNPSLLEKSPFDDAQKLKLQ